VPRQFAHISLSVEMKWGFKENRVAVIVFHKCGKSDYRSFELLKPLKIWRKFVCRLIKRYKELWGVEDRTRSARLKSVKAETAIKTVRERIRRNRSRNRILCPIELNILPPIDVTPDQGPSTHESLPVVESFCNRSNSKLKHER
jgi:hypothetical protein